MLIADYQIHNKYSCRSWVFRYGFNGQEKVDEVSGDDNSCTAEFWQYDSRLGRRWNLDPKPNPSASRYDCFSSNPILFADPFGDTVKYGGFKDRVNAIIGRTFSKTFRERFKSAHESTDTYLLRKEDKRPTLLSGGEIYNAPNRANSTEHIWGYSSIGRINVGISIVEMERTDMRTEETKVKIKHHEFSSRKPRFENSYTLNNYVPGTDIIVDAFNVPDLVDLTGCDDETEGPVLLGGSQYQNVTDRTKVYNVHCTEPVINIVSYRRNQKNSDYTDDGNIMGTAKDTDYTITYTRYVSKVKRKLKFGN